MKQLSPLRAIAANCHSCIYDKAEPGTAREQIEACQIILCSLHPYRPLSSKTRRLQRESKLAMLTPEQREIAEMRSEISRENMLKLHSKASGRGTEAARLN